MYELSKSSENLRKKANELGITFDNEKEDIASYNDKITELRKVINDSNSSLEETTTARRDLLSIQDELIAKYGEEETSVRLITDAINGQSDALDRLTDLKWQETLNAFNDENWTDVITNWGLYENNVERMVDEMTNHREILSFTRKDFDNDQFEELKKYLGELGWKYQETLGGFVKTGYLKDIYSDIYDIQDLIKGMNQEDVPDYFSKDLVKSANNAKDIIDNYADIWDDYVLREKILSNNTTANQFKEIQDIYSSYQKALESGNNSLVTQAILDFEEILKNSDLEPAIIEYFTNMYPVLASELEKLKYKTAISKINLDSLKGKTKSDMLAWETEKHAQDGEVVWDLVVDRAISYGIIPDKTIESYDKLVDILVELGIMQEEIIENSVNVPASFSDIFTLENSKDTLTHLGKISESIDKIQNAYQTLSSAIDEYNETGHFSIDTIQSITELGSGYLDYLIDEEGNIRFDQAALQDLTVARLQDMKAQMLQNLASQIESIKDETDANNFAAQSYIEKAEAIEELTKAQLKNKVANLNISDEAKANVLDAASEEFNQIEALFNNAIANVYKNPDAAIGNSNDTKSTKETFDWIETKLSRIQRTITNLGKTASATWKNWTTRNNSLAKQMSAVTHEIGVQQQAYDKYMAKANGIQFSASDEKYRDAVMNGGMNIDEISNEATKENIKQYQEWYEKALACEDAIIDLQDSLAKLAKTKFDNISKEYDDRIAMIEHHTSMLEGYVSRAEAAGFWASEVYYQKMAENELKNITQLQGKYNDLTNALNESIANGTVEKYSEQWYEMKLEINDVESALQEANTALVEFNQTLQQIHWDLFDRGVDYKNLFIEESNFLAEILSRRDLYNEVGKLTDEGLAVQGLHAVNYNAYMEQSETYAEEILKLNEEIANDQNDLQLIDRRNELIGLQQEAIKNAMAEKDAIKDLVEEAYGAMLESLQELIDKRKEALNAEKDLYDYQNTISEKTDTIASYQKQLQAYVGDNSEEAKATIQKLQVSLEEAERDLQDTQYERWLNDQQSMLDSLYNQSEEWVNTRLDNIDALVSEVIQATNDNATSIGDTITSVAETFDYNLSEYFNMLWNGDNDNTSLLLKAYEDVANGINAGTTRLETVLGFIDTKLQAMVDDLNEQAVVEAETIEQPNVEIHENNHYDSGASEPQPSTSGGITFTGGTFYEDSYKGGKTGNSRDQWTGREVEVTHESGTGMVHIVDKNTGTVLGWVDPDQLQGYYKGTTNAKKGFNLVSERGDELIQDNNGNVVLAKGMQLYPFRGGETVYKATDTEKILNGNLVPLDNQSFLQSLVKQPVLPNFAGMQNRNVSNEINMNITLPGVTDYDGFVSHLHTAIKNDRQTQKLVQAVTIDPVMGKNSLAKNRL